MRINLALLGLICFVFYFGWKTKQDQEAIQQKIVTGAIDNAIDVTKSYVKSQTSITNDWAKQLSTYWKSVWK